MRAIIYLRVSTPHQKRMGLRYQRKMCLQIADKFAIKERHVFKDVGVQGYMPVERRPGLLETLEMLEEGDVLIVASRDRLSRKPSYLIEKIEKIIAEAKAILVSAAGEGTRIEGVEGLKERRIADVNAEVFIEILRQKTKEALAIKRELGERNGTIPYGFELAANGRNLKPCSKEQEIIELAKLFKQQRHPVRKIALLVNELNYRSRNNKPFQPTQIVNILKKEGIVRQPHTKREMQAINKPHIDRKTPYGYKPAQMSSLEKCPYEQEVIGFVRQLREQKYPLRKIVNELMVTGYRSRTGKPSLLTQVTRILKATSPEDSSKVATIRQSSYDPELIKIVKELRSQGYILQVIVQEVNQRGYRGTTGKPLQLTQIARIIQKSS